MTPSPDHPTTGIELPKEQTAYAGLLGPVRYAALLLLAITFGIYVLGLREAKIPCRDVPRYWTLSSHELLKAVNLEPGWGWLDQVLASDFMNNLGICLLASVSGLCYLRVLPIFVARREWIIVLIVVAEILVMILAASGLVRGGH